MRERLAGFNWELEFMRTRWAHVVQDDPFFNPNLSLSGKRGRLATAPAGCSDTTTALVTMTPSTVTLGVGDTVRVSAVAGCASVGSFTFASTNAGVASVNATTGTVRALAVGDATILATNSVNPLVQGSATVSVR